MADKKRLGRGLDDLLAQHDQDLPFLDAYGPLDGEAVEPGTTVEQLKEAIERLLRSNQNDGSKITIEEVDDGVRIILRGEHLPLVPSDLGAPGLEGGSLDKDRSEATVTIVQWGIPARRLIERMCEHWAS